MLTGSTSANVLPMSGAVHYFLGGGDDPSRYPCAMNSLHELDAAVPRRGSKRRPAAAAGGQLFQCPICERTFCTEKAVHGHMRCHSERGWRGMEPPPPGELGADRGRLHRYVCHRCGAPFETRQGLGGHRASHRGKRGCSWLAKQELAEAAAAAAESRRRRPDVVFEFDLNEPAPEAAEQEEIE